jgi:hypothetical protein
MGYSRLRCRADQSDFDAVLVLLKISLVRIHFRLKHIALPRLTRLPHLPQARD